jgi:hypothetical protein
MGLGGALVVLSSFVVFVLCHFGRSLCWPVGYRLPHKLLRTWL